MVITANELKIKGVSLLEQMFQDVSELLISVRGKPKYVVIPVEEYEQIRESELDRALVASVKDIKNGNYHSDTERFFEEVGI